MPVWSKIFTCFFTCSGHWPVHVLVLHSGKVPPPSSAIGDSVFAPYCNNRMNFLANIVFTVGCSRLRKLPLHHAHVRQAIWLRYCSVRRTGSKNRLSRPATGAPWRAVSAAGGVLSESALPVDVLGENDGQRVGVVARFQLRLAKFVDEDLHADRNEPWVEGCVTNKKKTRKHSTRMKFLCMQASRSWWHSRLPGTAACPARRLASSRY